MRSIQEFMQSRKGIMPWLNTPSKSRKNGRQRTKGAKGAFGSSKLPPPVGGKALCEFCKDGHSVAWCRKHGHAVKVAA